MSIFLDSVTGSLVNKALDLTWLEHTLHLNNIANSNVAGFHAQRADFSNILGEISQAIESGASEDVVKGLVNNLQTDALQVESTGNLVKLDEEMALLTQANIRFEALLNAKSKFGSITKMAIKGGKG